MLLPRIVGRFFRVGQHPAKAAIHTSLELASTLSLSGARGGKLSLQCSLEEAWLVGKRVNDCGNRSSSYNKTHFAYQSPFHKMTLIRPALPVDQGLTYRLAG